MWWMPLSFMALVSSSTALLLVDRLGRIIARATISWTRAPCLRFPGQLVSHELVGALGPVAQDWARVARVDDLLDAEALCGPERRGDGLEPGSDLLAQRRRVL